VSENDLTRQNTVIANLFETFQDVPRPDKLRGCDCGSCFSNADAKVLHSQSLDNINPNLLFNFFNHFSVTQDKIGIKYLLPAFAKTISEATKESQFADYFYCWTFGGLLKDLGFETWPSAQQTAIWEWLEVELDKLLSAGQLDKFDDWVTSLIRPNFEWTRFTSLLLEPRHSKAKLGYIAYFLPWENGYETAPKGFELLASESDSLREKHKTAYYDWMIYNLI